MSRSEQTVSKRQCRPSLDRATDKSAINKQCQDKRYPGRWIPSERFWDTLPRIHLTRRALAEHDRRNRLQDLKLQPSEEIAPRQPRSKRLRKLAHQEQVHLPHCAGDVKFELELRRFARGGGPDLTRIRGYPDPTMSNRPSRPSTRSDGLGLTTSSKRSSLYDANYQIKLAQAGIFLTEETDENNRRVKPTNYSEIVARLSKPRPSLSSSQFTEQDFERFQERTEQGILESEIMQQSMTIIEGSGGHVLSRMGGPFNNLKPFDPDLAMAVPDSYDGSPPLSINRHVLNDLDQYIVPNTEVSRPAAPNFFLECKGQKGRADVAKRQAAHTGAIGARGMMSLQSHPTGVVQYDGNAYAYTSTYHDGQLKMYTTHATAPKATDGFPSYHMTQLRGFSMTDNSKTFREGATHYRNARDLAKEQRDACIQRANQAARQAPAGKYGSHSRTSTNTGFSMRTDRRSRE